MTRQPHEGILPTSALEIRGSAPTSAEVFNTKQVEFGLDYIYQWELSKGVTIAGSTGFATNGYGDVGFLPDEPATDRFTAYTQSAVLGLELGEANTIYAEWYGVFSDGLEDEFVVSVFNVGVDHYVTDDFVLDIRVGVGLSDDSDDFFSGIGGGYRF